MQFTPDVIVNIVAVVIILTILAYLWYKGKKKEVLVVIAYLVDKAEKDFGSGTGEYKYAFVISHVYHYLPSIIRAIVSAKTVDGWIEDEVNKLQEKLQSEVNK